MVGTSGAVSKTAQPTMLSLSSSFCCITKGLLAVGLIFTAESLSFAAESWRGRLAPVVPGPFPLIRSFHGEFRFGWSNIEAAGAVANFSNDGGQIRVEVSGGTTGLARTLWEMDATHKAWIRADGLQPVYFEQLEKYAKKTVEMQAVFKPDVLWYWRRVSPDPTNAAKWKRLKIEPVRDIISAMLFIRSQPLRDGDAIGVIAFPGDAPYLVETKVAGRTTIDVGGQMRPAIKLEFALKKIEVKKGGRLTEHKKFRNGTVWLSDDPDRIPLRAEVNIFVGFVYGELKSLTFDPPKTGN